MRGLAEIVALVVVIARLLSGCASMEEDWDNAKQKAEKWEELGYYDIFIRLHPDSPHVPEARQRMDALVERSYQAATSFTGPPAEHRKKYSDFIRYTLRYNREHPRGQDAARELEALWWADTKEGTSRSGLRAYLREYPQGRYAAEGRPAYERLKAAALADPIWASGTAPNECVWRCEGSCDPGVPGMREQVLEFAKVKQPTREPFVFSMARPFKGDGVLGLCGGRRDVDQSVHETWCSLGDVSVRHDLSNPNKPVTTALRRVLGPAQAGSGGSGWERYCD